MKTGTIVLLSALSVKSGYVQYRFQKKLLKIAHINDIEPAHT